MQVLYLCRHFVLHIYQSNARILTLKKSHVAPCNSVPYSTSVCDARSSGEFIGATILSTVRNAAKLAVYEDIIINVKNHHTQPTILPETDLMEQNKNVLTKTSACACRLHLPRRNVTSLLHEGSQREPQGVHHAEIVRHRTPVGTVGVVRVAVLPCQMQEAPFVRRESIKEIYCCI